MFEQDCQFDHSDDVLKPSHVKQRQPKGLPTAPSPAANVARAKSVSVSQCKAPSPEETWRNYVQCTARCSQIMSKYDVISMKLFNTPRKYLDNVHRSFILFHLCPNPSEVGSNTSGRRRRWCTREGPKRESVPTPEFDNMGYRAKTGITRNVEMLWNMKGTSWDIQHVLFKEVIIAHYSMQHHATVGIVKRSA